MLKPPPLGVTVIPLPILSDNYAYLVVDTVSNVAIVVDPADPEEVQVHMLRSSPMQ